MSPFDALARVATGTIQSVFGSLTAFVYSRPYSPNFDGIAAFPIKAALNAGGENAGPSGPFTGYLLVSSGDIDQGPQKGDIVTISSAPAPMRSGDYIVQEIFQDAAAGWANLMIRFKQ
jgi:hypothetical protein